MPKPELALPVVPAIPRRDFLRGVSAASLAMTVGGGPLAAEDARSAKSELIVRGAGPMNLEMPFQALDGLITPNELFYVRNHFPVPQLDSTTWRLEVTGRVATPLRLSLKQLQELSKVEQVALLECAGNGRAFLEPKAKGVQWEMGAVGNAKWKGVPLAAVLDQAGIGEDVVDVILEGADKGEVADDPKSPGAIHFARSLPIEKALNSDVLLAWGMNGEPLPAEHGFPLRAIVPGWYGMASIKWLKRIIVADRPFHGYYQSLHYSYFQRLEGTPSLTPITTIQVKSHIARPAAAETIPAGRDYRVHGAAWAGECAVTKVELSLDNGKSWTPIRLARQEHPHAWRLWEFDWKSPPAGKHRLMVRATDEHQRTQPLTRDADRRNYVINHVVPVEVTVA